MFKPTHQKLTLHTQTLRAHPERRKMRLYGRSRQISDDWQPRPSNLVSYQWRLLRCCQICAAIDGGIRHDNAVYLFHLVIRFTGVAYVAFCSARMRAFCRELSVSFARFTACATVLFLLLALFLATLFHSLSLSLLYLSCAFFDHSRSHSRSHSCALLFSRSLSVLLQYPVSEEIIKKRLDRNANRNGNQNRKGSYYFSFLTLFRIPLRAAF